MLAKQRIKKLFLPVVIFILILGGCTSKEDSIWFDSLQDKFILAPADVDSIGTYIHKKMYDEDYSNVTLPARIVDDRNPRMLFLSVSNGLSAARVFIGRGYGIINAIDYCLQTVNEEIEINKIKWVKIDLVNEVISRKIQNVKNSLMWDRSLFGLAFSKESNIAFLPEELVANTIVNSKQKIRKKNIRKYLAENSDLKEAVNDIFEEDSTQIFRFLTYSSFIQNEKIIPLYRGHRMFEELNSDQVLDAAVNGGKYLANAVNPGGDFVYSYLPKINKEKKDYNIVRHAGTIFSMLQLHDVTGESELLEKSQTALEYLKSTIEVLSTHKGNFNCVVENGNTKLGANALAMIALLSFYNKTNETEYLNIAKQLGEYILAAMDDTGEFVIQKQLYPNGTVTDMRSEYYPGEALLALVTLYKSDRKAKWLNTAELGAKYLITIRDGKKKDKELAHDHWLLYALNELYRFRSNKLYYNHSMRLANVIINSQRTETELRDWVGSFYNPPRSTPTATRMEGLHAAYQLAHDYGNKEMRQKIKDALEKGIKFQLQTQFRPETAMYLENPQRSLGGFKRSLTNYELRIDYTQHNISSLLGMYHILKKEK
jgi:hypothetical protein